MSRFYSRSNFSYSRFSLRQFILFLFFMMAVTGVGVFSSPIFGATVLAAAGHGSDPKVEALIAELKVIASDVARGKVTPADGLKALDQLEKKVDLLISEQKGDPMAVIQGSDRLDQLAKAIADLNNKFNKM